MFAKGVAVNPTYDAIGNPLTYDGNTYTWQNGRQLGGITNEDENSTNNQ